MIDNTVVLQRTIARPASVSGIGLHTGVLSTVTFRPAAPDSGVTFYRVDLPGAPAIEADMDHVVSTTLRTALGRNGVIVNTVEHILAALAGLGIDNLNVDVDAPEVPGMDGSALPFVRALKRAGVAMQDRPRRLLATPRRIRYHREDVSLSIEPGDDLRISMGIRFDHPSVGAQHASVVIRPETFEEELAPARTFGFLCHMRKLRDQGVIKGVSLDNSIVIGDDGVLNDDLRFPDEFVRHKILDLLGDIYLLGKPLTGHITAARAGHASHIAFSRRLRESMDIAPTAVPARAPAYIARVSAMRV
ncbi:MAG TPA: UDP-3-O-acyl-N-acetylglucosamine deacetylase [Candidatus Hydrogenedentes bacterium]|nr:UDP-3-O-acyl-N-acetylglucosamine deacetylase [Candidatus Hydrogenedentota bacterium]HOS03127.1 UDP-3-O-acyl-N-acetylglucosamine deacetylase [Candidatus Hydrogenedentota bacterium]